ncbi:MAG TPA: 2Fe-2S iron-sulfur cluster-binding protein [Capsulimonadaceae bacterium]|nr:2Fe-2S iron-sulfur cluster-binding protein [Capsulimonadaceae bacterium]
MPRDTQNIPPVAAGLAPGAPAPDFTLKTAEGERISLSERRGRPVMLAFYPPDWDPARVGELAQFQELAQALRDHEAELFGVSMDSTWSRIAASDPRIGFPVLTDLNPPGGVARRYGAYGRQALFVIDAEGIIRWRFIAPPGLSPRAETILAGLESLGRSESAKLPSWKTPISRREFVGAALAAAFAIAVWPAGARRAEADTVVPTPSDPAAQPPGPNLPADPAGAIVPLNVNGVLHNVPIEPRVTLLDALRERIGLTGSKKGCDHGQCGACTVLIDGRRELSCLTLALAASGRKITTIEGLANADKLHPMQQAFLEHDGFQCGYCTPGQIISAVALLKENVGPADADVREQMSGNICRCGAYPNIVAAIQSARKK